MTIQIMYNAADLSIKLGGRLDSTTVEEFESVLNKELTANTSSLTIDLEHVDFISSKGLRVLVSAYKTLSGKPMTLTNANPSIMELLRLSGLLKIFTVK